ncbi:MAG: Uma2 family endonuclease [Anaerolineae bacterium]|nr:Uma2 family endonuclease [Anaerolineae bacterium]MCA9894456.1 Uma2 family endonuclease [Anaerolineae bacterium]
MVLNQQTYTADDLWGLANQEAYYNKRLYLIEGALYVMAPASWLHGDIALEIGSLLRNHVRSHGLGRTTAAETGYILAEGTVLAPDVGFIASERIPNEIPVGFVPFAPDLAVEVVSPNDRASDVQQKVETYLKYGTKMVWVIDPNRNTVAVYRPATEGASVTFLDIDDQLSGDDIVPGFVCLIRELFPNK